MQSVDRLITLQSAPRCWTVPQGPERVAYLLDLSGSTVQWRKGDGAQMSMAAIIKAEVRV